MSQKVLTDSLRSLEEDGVIVRTVYPEVPPRVEYALSDLGNSMRPILDSMEQWGGTIKRWSRQVTRENKRAGEAPWHIQGCSPCSFLSGQPGAGLSLKQPAPTAMAVGAVSCSLVFQEVPELLEEGVPPWRGGLPWPGA